MRKKKKKGEPIKQKKKFKNSIKDNFLSLCASVDLVTPLPPQTPQLMGVIPFLPNLED